MRISLRSPLLCSLLFALVARQTCAAANIAIDHAEVGCVEAEKFVRIEARLDPAAEVGRARVYFRADGTPSWYYVEMKASADRHEAVLPAPKGTTGRINYYVDVESRSFVESRTPEYAPRVVAGAESCSGKMASAAAAVGSLLVFGPAGAPAIPAGFGSVGLLGAGATTTAGGAAGAASGGGISGKALIIGGAVVAGGAAVAIAAGGSDGNSGGRQILLSETVNNVQSRVGNVFRTFRTPGAGNVDASGDWTDAAKNIDIYIADASCVSFHECQFLAQSSTSAKPERIPAFHVAAAASYNLFIVNESDGVESAVRVEVGYTP